MQFGDQPQEEGQEECHRCKTKDLAIQERDEEIKQLKDKYDSKIKRLGANLEAQVKENERQRIAFKKKISDVNAKHGQALKKVEVGKQKQIESRNNCTGNVAQAFSSILHGEYIQPKRHWKL